MQTHSTKLLTIITEDILEESLTQDLMELGAKGYTVTKAQGRGLQRIRTSEWEGENIRIETLVSENNANKILKHLSNHYFEKYGMVAFLSDVEVLRKDKYQ